MMDTRTGKIIAEDDLEQYLKDHPEARRYVKPMAVPPTPHQRKTRKIGRNEPCPCNSGKKFKKCCLGKPAV